ncbi:multidrug DMT transporter permease [Salinicola endophyticus]|uniref:Multidrug DMT transporter permease n=1 Tax=Salinicola endophyticus TaxID=1949083 RepID=A0ABY8FBE7_9GAMM|nr:iron uptake system protein EfeO [Salinicola endophyticus]WFF40123.1 multidrug DMT transporter permease [Salinicola endophyticus]
MNSTHATPSTAHHAPSPRLMRLGLVASFLLMLIAFGVFALSLRAVESGSDDGTLIEIGARGCQPSRVEVPAGERTFTIVNRSDRAIEWEVIDGVMVLAERENIAPGMRQPLRVDLAPGDYAMTCGLLSNPHGELHVTPNGNAAPARALAAHDFVGARAELRVYTTLQMRKLERASAALAQAINAGDLTAARTAYLQARRIDQRLAMPIGLFGDLDQRLNAPADYYAGREKDPDFGGFPRLAQGLFSAGSTAGLAPVAKQLMADLDVLSRRLAQASVPPAQLANGSARALQTWHDRATDGEMTPLALNDLAGITEGSAKIVTLIDPLLARQAPALQRQLDQALSALQQSLAEAAQPGADGTTSTAESAAPDALQALLDAGAVPAATAQRLLANSEALAKALAAVNHALALSG